MRNFFQIERFLNKEELFVKNKIKTKRRFFNYGSKQTHRMQRQQLRISLQGLQLLQP